MVEGVRLAEEALASGWPAKLVLFSEDLSDRGRKALAGFAERGAPCEQVTPKIMRLAGDTENPQGIIAVLSHNTLSLTPDPDFIFVPDQMRDPGNLGTMLRSAASAGVEAVLIPPKTVDPFAPKVVRAAMGAHFNLPIHLMSWKNIETYLKPCQVVIAAVNEGVPYTSVDYHDPMALIIGGEAEGASSHARRIADLNVHIPMPGGGDSLNAAVAAGILLFEVARQRSSMRQG